MIHLSIDDGIARLTLDRPEARHALSIAGWERLAALVEQVRGTEVRLLVVSGTSGAFCAGADLSEFTEIQANEAMRTRFRLAMRQALDALRDLPIATLAVIDGPCFGAGVALAMACDIRVASVDARFAITPAKMGIGYPQEDVARLVSLVGPGWASRLLFTGSAIGAEEALRIGLVEQVDGAEDLASEIAACDPASIAMLKRGIALAEQGVARDVEQDRRFDALFGSPLLAERLSQRRTGRALPPGRA